MIPAIRQKEILKKLYDSKILTIDELAQQFDVSSMTIRRDIDRLEKDGKVVGVSGGVKLIKMLYSEMSHDIKEVVETSHKKTVGRTAANFIPHNSTIYLDAGTTTLEIAKNITSLENINVITNDFVISSLLMESSNCGLYHIGGKIDRKNKSTIGQSASYFLNNINIDVAFISTSSLGMNGISTPCEEKVVIKKAIAQTTKHNILVTDASKFGKIATFHALDMNVFNTIITDARIPEIFKSHFKKLGIKVVIAS